MPSRSNTAIIAAAGGRKTQGIIDAALSNHTARVLITTYTNQNLNQIRARIQARVGVFPPNVHTAGWFSFLLSQGVRPYQSAVFKTAGLVGGLNFVGKRPFYARANTRQYYLDSNADVYRDGVADLVCRIDVASGGRVIRRLEQVFDHIFIDEVQDLVGYDLDLLDRLLRSKVAITVVGDPRQHTFATSNVSKNKKYRGAGFVDWINERSDICIQEHRNESHRCQQEICDFASALFPDFPALTSAHADATGHDGIHEVSHFEVLAYVEEHRPQVLRWNKKSNTQGLPALNIGVSKGSTYDRVLIFPTTPMRQYLQHRDPSRLKAPEMLYVAVTRARHSVAFVV